MSNETRLDRVDTIGRLLLIVRDALEPIVWRHRHCDHFAYFQVQEQRTEALSAAELGGSDEHTRTPRATRIKRRVLSDPQKLLRLLKLSRRLRAELCGDGDDAYEHVVVLLAVRGTWAHGDAISRRDVDRALTSAERLLRAAGATKAVHQVATLRWRGPTEWPKDAA